MTRLSIWTLPLVLGWSPELVILPLRRASACISMLRARVWMRRRCFTWLTAICLLFRKREFWISEPRLDGSSSDPWKLLLFPEEASIRFISHLDLLVVTLLSYTRATLTSLSLVPSVPMALPMLETSSHPLPASARNLEPLPPRALTHTPSLLSSTIHSRRYSLICTSTL